MILWHTTEPSRFAAESLRARRRPIPARSATLALLGLAITAGCTVVIDPRIPLDADPASGPALKITRVTDQRAFRSFSNASPWTPSLDASERSGGDRKLVVGRLRGAYGSALTNVYLTEGRDVEVLVREALTTAFRRSGYRVLDLGAPGYDGAPSLEADILRFWSWTRPGFVAWGLENEIRVALQGDADPFREGGEACGYLKLRSQSARARQFRTITVRGIQDFVDNLAGRLGLLRSEPGSAAAFVDERCLEGRELLP